MATAWLAGGSGLVGGALLRRILRDDHFDKVVSVGRRPLPIRDPKLVQVETDFATPSVFDAQAAPSVAFCCLGTTIKKAGSREAFRKVDHDRARPSETWAGWASRACTHCVRRFSTGSVARAVLARPWDFSSDASWRRCSASTDRRVWKPWSRAWSTWPGHRLRVST